MNKHALLLAALLAAPTAYAWGDREQGALAGVVAGALIANHLSASGSYAPPRQPIYAQPVPQYVPTQPYPPVYYNHNQYSRQPQCVQYTTFDYRGNPVGQHTVCR